MARSITMVLAWLMVNLALANGPDSAPAPGGKQAALSAAQIVRKNVDARGGQDAWRKILTMVWTGHIEPGNGALPSLPYVLDMKRPDKTHFEINAHGQIIARTFDGLHGWKLKPMPNGRPLLEPYSARELSFARDVHGIGWPLMENRVKDTAIKLEGTDDIEGHQAYCLSISRPSGYKMQVWIDAASFLDIKTARESRNASGNTVKVSMYYRDYKAVDGVKLPFMIESTNESGITIDKMVIDHVALNAPLDDRVFGRPTLSLLGNPSARETSNSRRVDFRTAYPMMRAAAPSGSPFSLAPSHGH